MSQLDNRNPSTAKRARTDGGRREDDWTCPGCGNVNFSFRTTCNMRNCTQPRPADHNVKSAGKPMQPHQPYPSAGPYGGGSGAPPSSMYLGMPPYGSSMFNGSSVPPYDVPYPGGSTYPYSYANRMSGGSPYRPLPISGPPPAYSGGMYGMPPPMMDRYGLSMPHMAPPPMGPRPGFFQDDNSQKKDMPRENDWICPKCGNVNFSFRITCNMRKCGTPKPGLQTPKFEKNSKPKMPDGSWKCEECGNMNYPFRSKCNRQNCGAEKPSEDNRAPSPEAEQNEQVCVVICLLCLLCSLLILSRFNFCKTFPDNVHTVDGHGFLGSENINCVIKCGFFLCWVGSCTYSFPYSFTVLSFLFYSYSFISLKISNDGSCQLFLYHFGF